MAPFLTHKGNRCFLHACSLMLSKDMRNCCNSEVQIAKCEIHNIPTLSRFLYSLLTFWPFPESFSFLFMSRTSPVYKINVPHIITSLSTSRWKEAVSSGGKSVTTAPGLPDPSARQATWLGAVLLLTTCCETRRKLMHPSVLLLLFCQF